jgi:nitroreductase
MTEIAPADLLALMQGRRSVRAFRPDPVPEAVEHRLLQALIAAPSAGNVQPWVVVRVRGAGPRQALAAAAFGQGFIAEAPLVLVVGADLRAARESYAERGETLYALQDTAAAVQNLLLMAHACGLGACWIGAFDEAEVARLAGLEPGVRPVALIPVGVPAEQPLPPPRRAVEEVSHVR